MASNSLESNSGCQDLGEHSWSFGEKSPLQVQLDFANMTTGTFYVCTYKKKNCVQTRICTKVVFPDGDAIILHWNVGRDGNQYRVNNMGPAYSSIEEIISANQYTFKWAIQSDLDTGTISRTTFRLRRAHPGRSAPLLPEAHVGKVCLLYNVNSKQVPFTDGEFVRVLRWTGSRYAVESQLYGEQYLVGRDNLEHLSRQPCYFGQRTAKEADEALHNASPGTFLVRRLWVASGNYTYYVHITSGGGVKCLEANYCHINRDSGVFIVEAAPGESCWFYTLDQLLSHLRIAGLPAEPDVKAVHCANEERKYLGKAFVYRSYRRPNEEDVNAYNDGDVVTVVGLVKGAFRVKSLSRPSFDSMEIAFHTLESFEDQVYFYGLVGEARVRQILRGAQEGMHFICRDPTDGEHCLRLCVKTGGEVRIFKILYDTESGNDYNYLVPGMGGFRFRSPQQMLTYLGSVSMHGANVKLTKLAPREADEEKKTVTICGRMVRK